MTYEEKYNQALEQAKKIKHDITTIGCTMDVDMLDLIFPEFVEDEDEKIRKELIEQVVYIVPNDDEIDSEGNVLPIYQI